MYKRQVLYTWSGIHFQYKRLYSLCITIIKIKNNFRLQTKGRWSLTMSLGSAGSNIAEREHVNNLLHNFWNSSVRWFWLYCVHSHILTNLVTLKSNASKMTYSFIYHFASLWYFPISVSYTHLDVYKRQVLNYLKFSKCNK